MGASDSSICIKRLSKGQGMLEYKEAANCISWSQICQICQNPQAGVKVKYKHAYGRKLVGDRTTKSKLITIFTESQFVDDAALHSNTRAAFGNTTKSFVSEASKWRVTVNIRRQREWLLGRQMRTVKWC